MTVLMPPPPNRYPVSNSSLGIQSPNQSQDLLEIAAQQSINEDTQNNGGVEVVKRVNINFQSLKIQDSKKRVKTPTFMDNGVQGNSGNNMNVDIQMENVSSNIHQSEME